MSNESLPIYIQPSDPTDSSWCSWAIVPYEGRESFSALNERVELSFSPILALYRSSIIHLDARHQEGSIDMGIEVHYRNPGIVPLIHNAIASAMYAESHHTELADRTDYYVSGCRLDTNGEIIRPDDDRS